MNRGSVEGRRERVGTAVNLGTSSSETGDWDPTVTTVTSRYLEGDVYRYTGRDRSDKGDE